jgi:hypothetical protein
MNLQFEAWYTGRYRKAYMARNINSDGTLGSYTVFDVQYAWTVWQESRAALWPWQLMAKVRPEVGQRIWLRSSSGADVIRDLHYDPCNGDLYATDEWLPYRSEYDLLALCK